jgi:exodeoxyribonuclease V alpha subunit
VEGHGTATPAARRSGAATPRPGSGAAHGTTLEGILERVTYANEETAWSVVKLAVPGRRHLVTVVGNLLGVQPGENLRLRGRWTVDRKYGEQFRADSYVTVKPATLVGIEKYLGSGLVRGVGKVMAKRLVEHFGLATLEVIDAVPERLQEVDGIGPIRRTRIAQAWVEQRQVRDVMVFLQAHGVSTTFAIKIYRHYRERSIAVVKENPLPPGDRHLRHRVQDGGQDRRPARHLTELARARPGRGVARPWRDLG